MTPWTALLFFFLTFFLALIIYLLLISIACFYNLLEDLLKALILLPFPSRFNMLPFAAFIEILLFLYSALRPSAPLVKLEVLARQTKPSTMEEFFFNQRPSLRSFTQFLWVLQAHNAPTSEILRVFEEVQRYGCAVGPKFFIALYGAIATSRDNNNHKGRLKCSQLLFSLLEDQKRMQVERNTKTYW